MGILGFFRRAFSRPKLELIGNVEPVCPYCNQQLPRRPGKKCKCPHCGSFIYVRTRPSDRKQVLVTEEQAGRIEEQWSIVNGTHREFLAAKRRREAERVIVRRALGREPTEADVTWGLLNKRLVAHAQDEDWASYSSAKLEMGELLQKEGKLEKALQAYLEVCYLDLNGPSNVSAYRRDRELLRKYPAFDPRGQGFLAPEVLRRIGRIMRKLERDAAVLQETFEQAAGRLERPLRLPLAVPQAWKKIAAALF